MISCIADITPPIIRAAITPITTIIQIIRILDMEVAIILTGQQKDGGNFGKRNRQ